MSSSTTTTNYSLYTIPAAWVLSIVPHFYAAYVARHAGGLDNTNPRHTVEQLKSKLSASDFGAFQRAEAAQTNGFENLAFFASAVVAANAAKVPVSTLNSASFFYLASRALFNVLYINTETVSAAKYRSFVFLAGVGSIFTLFIKAGNVLNASYF